FILGGAPALLALYIRAHVPESKAWERVRPQPSAIWRAIRSNAGVFVYLVMLMTMMNLISHGTQDIYPTFLERQRGFGPREVATIVLVIGAIVIAFGSERLGADFHLTTDQVDEKTPVTGTVA